MIIQIENLIQGALASILAAGIILLVSLLFKRMRYFLFFHTHSYEFEWDQDFGSCQWDIQWATFRLTIKAEKVHNDHLEGVSVMCNKVKPELEMGDIRVANEFTKLKNTPIELRVNSIVRTKPDRNPNEYLIFIDIRRRKW